MHLDDLYTELNAATMAPSCGDGSALGWIADAAIGVSAGRIAWIGPASAAPAATRVHRMGGRLVTPALIDCHTHLVFAGDRSDEWARRLAGESYADIARAGGGIRSTVRATRQADEEELIVAALARLEVLAAEGVGTVEIKSGYGLERDTELRMLRAARAVGGRGGVRVVTSLLAAHAVPSEYDGRADDYLEEVVLPLVDEARALGLADAVDAFCESIAFTPEQTRRVFEAARAAGLPVKLHADQLEDSGGAALAARFGALSADHLEYASAEGVQAMAAAGTVAVLLPGAFYALGETRRPPVRTMRAAGVPMAVATDANPGSSPLLSPLTACHMACTLFGLTVEEAFAGVTRHAARALGLDAEVGTLEVGRRAELAVWEVDGVAELVQWIGRRPLHRRILAGE